MTDEILLPYDIREDEVLIVCRESDNHPIGTIGPKSVNRLSMIENMLQGEHAGDEVKITSISHKTDANGNIVVNYIVTDDGGDESDYQAYLFYEAVQTTDLTEAINKVQRALVQWVEDCAGEDSDEAEEINMYWIQILERLSNHG